MDGTSIFRYDTNDPTNPVEIATIGEPSGGIAFDSLGNLYYASQVAGQGVLKFDALDVDTGGLDASDGTTVANITCAGIGFLSDDTLLAETGYGQLLAAYDVTTGNKLYDIATTTSYDYMGKFIVGDDDTIYILSNDWMYYEGVLSEITVSTPEPTAMGLLAVGGLALLRRRRK